MKKFKEFLCFIVPIFLLFVLHAALLMARLNNGMFMGGWHYLVLFLRDALFWKTVWDTYSIVFWPALLAAAVLALLRYLVRKKIRISALAYYLVSTAAGSVAALGNMLLFTWHFLKYRSCTLYATWPMVWQSIRADDILLCLLAGVLAAFVIWVGSLLLSWIRKLFTKSHGNAREAGKLQDSGN